MLKFFAEYLVCLEALHVLFEKAIEGLPQEALDWVPGKDMNSLCVLVVHTAAVERYWIGDVAGQSPSNRNRAAEFEAHGLSEAELKKRLADSLTFVQQYFETLSLEDMDGVRTSALHPGNQYTVSYGLEHALEHTGLHLGHAQITRQLWDQRQ